MTMFPGKRVPSLLLVLAVAVTPFRTSGQTAACPPDGMKSSISAVAGAEYISAEGLFRIQLLPPSDRLVWQFIEGEVRLGYFDYLWAVKDVDLVSFESTAEQFDRETLSKIPGKIIEKVSLRQTDPYHSKTHFYFDDGRFGLQSHAMNKKRYYSILTVFNSLLDRHKFEAVIDTFKVTGDADNESIMQKRIRDRTLSSLPQHPTVKGENTDLIDENIKGQVARIVEETESLHEGARSTTNGRYVREIIDYDRRGYCLKKIQTGQYGNPDTVEVWGFIDGKRVSKLGFSFDRYSLFDPVVGPPLVEGPNIPDPTLGYDPRYYVSYKKRYRAGKLVEHVWLDNSGRINLRREFSYAPNKLTTTVSGDKGDFRFRTISTINKDGLPMDEEYHSPPHHNSLPNTSVFTYTFDKKGNWIKKVVSTKQTQNGKVTLRPQYAIHRTITYY